MKPVYWLAALPVLAFFGGGWLTGVAPTFVLGVPFLLFWNVVWMVLTALILAFIDRRHPLAAGGEQGGGR
ncbi:hypothetical protein CAL29_24465 [Bordetella genomosp. 10]|uniref:DUF3311 domain-containing protein n=1 Tax=Bordetella genomosp. 10 TaxID=1416804 RepID=A0A261S2E0_9BORD|nr:DUF3311 domain-containing protein [Bordetella genomosp. 10]OZI31092.1 hypothetical protein CAL29_24465 [Bordetella genomosp. 10]